MCLNTRVDAYPALHCSSGRRASSCRASRRDPPRISRIASISMSPCKQAGQGRQEGGQASRSGTGRKWLPGSAPANDALRPAHQDYAIICNGGRAPARCRWLIMPYQGCIAAPPTSKATPYRGTTRSWVHWRSREASRHIEAAVMLGNSSITCKQAGRWGGGQVGGQAGERLGNLLGTLPCPQHRR